jgi:alpha-1,6-mannosyltransferase
LVRRAEVTARWMTHTAVIWGGAFVVAAPMASRDVYAYACQGLLYVSGFNPYHTGPAAVASPWLPSMSAMWQHTAAPYGPLAIVLSGAAAAASGGHLLLAVGWLRLTALAGVVLIAVFVPRLARACGVEPVVAMWLAVASPLVAVELLAGAHHDALTIGLLLAGLDLAVRGRGWPAGVALGLAGAVKVTALVVLPFAVLLVALPLAGRWRLPRATGTVALGAVGTLFAVTVASGLDVGWIGAAADTHPVLHWLSPPTAVGLVAGAVLQFAGMPHGQHIGVAAVRILAAYVALPAVLVVLWWRARRHCEAARIIEHGGWALTAMVLLSPVVYPWYFLAPLSVLAVSTQRSAVRTALAAATVLGVFVVLPDGFNLARLTRWPGSLLETAVLAALAVRFVRSRSSGAGHGRRRGAADPTTP